MAKHITLMTTTAHQENVYVSVFAPLSLSGEGKDIFTYTAAFTIGINAELLCLLMFSQNRTEHCLHFVLVYVTAFGAFGTFIVKMHLGHLL